MMAKRYYKLPSEILGKATLIDFKVMDVAESYANYQRVIQETGRPPAPKMTEEELVKRLERSREIGKQRKNKK